MSAASDLGLREPGWVDEPATRDRHAPHGLHVETAAGAALALQDRGAAAPMDLAILAAATLIRLYRLRQQAHDALMVAQQRLDAATRERDEAVARLGAPADQALRAAIDDMAVAAELVLATAEDGQRFGAAHFIGPALAALRTIKTRLPDRTLSADWFDRASHAAREALHRPLPGAPTHLPEPPKAEAAE